MSQMRSEFGTHTGKGGEDLRVTIKGPGPKSVLSILAGYFRSNFSAPTVNSFWGRIIIIDGEYTFPDDVNIATAIKSKVLLDHHFNSLGLIDVQYPIAGLDSTKSTDGGVVTVILSLGTNAGGDAFTPQLTIAGQH